MITVTAHAAARWIERVDPALTVEQARAVIASHETAIEKASAFGCDTVLLAKGIRLKLDGSIVVTVTHSHPARIRDPYKIIARGIRQKRQREREGAAL